MQNDKEAVIRSVPVGLKVVALTAASASFICVKTGLQCR